MTGLLFFSWSFFSRFDTAILDTPKTSPISSIVRSLPYRSSTSSPGHLVRPQLFADFQDGSSGALHPPRDA